MASSDLRANTIRIEPNEFAEHVAADGSALWLHFADAKKAAAVLFTVDQLQNFIGHLLETHMKMKLTEVISHETPTDSPKPENHSAMHVAFVRELEGATHERSGYFSLRITNEKGERVLLVFPPHHLDMLRAILVSTGPTLQ